MWPAIAVVGRLLLGTVFSRILPSLGRFFVRHPIVTAIGADLATDGASTKAIMGTAGNVVEKRLGLEGGASLNSIFNSFADSMQKNGIFAAVPLFAALGAASGGGVLGRIFSAVALGAVAYIGARIAEAHGIQMPGLSLDFGAAAKPGPATGATPPPRPSVVPAPAPQF